ncbi:MAG: hypothetical protein MK105_03090 [Crocinitomicaceae bacterium]|nr:hypothetical protein [Crocinitomicaceae bacterium]
MLPSTNDKIYKGVSILLFSFVFIYLLLRIIFNETLHDEVATYIFFFYHGNYIGEEIVWDANNHLLNSFIGNILYQFVGDNIPVLRLPNLLAFVAYFFGTIQLTKFFKTSLLKSTSLIALNSIPFIMEYFGNARGYGLSLGFFVWGLVHLHRYFNARKLKSLCYTYLFLLLAVSANLTFVNSSLLILVAVIIAPFINTTKRTISVLRKEWGLHALFLLSLIPFIAFGMALRHTGALYYGSLDGLWKVTGKTLSQYVLFFQEDWLQFVYLGIFICFIFLVIVTLKSIHKNEWFQKKYLIYAYLFFGNLIGILVLANLMEVNYPEDRTGMYLVILFLLMTFHVLEKFSFGNWLQISLLFFPITLFTHLSLHTSVFSPDDRMNNEFFAKVKAEIQPEHSIMIYRIMNWNWPYHESHEEKKSSVGLFYNENTTLTDIIVTKTTMLKNPRIPELYDTIAVHEPSTYIAFKRKQPLDKVVIDSTNFITESTNGAYLNVGAISCDSLTGKNVQFTVEGHLKTKELKNKIVLVLETKTADNATERYLYYPIETIFQGQLIDDDLLLHFVLEDIQEEEKEIKVYLWNRGFNSMELKRSRCTLTELKTPKNESR